MSNKNKPPDTTSNTAPLKDQASYSLPEALKIPDPDHLPKSPKNWNEIEFLSWLEFKQMAPAIVQLEITRIGRMIDLFPLKTDFRNALVKARFDLKKFSDALQDLKRPPLPDPCTGRLQSAIITLSLEDADANEDLLKALQYILDRLNYVYQRIDLIYE